MTRPTSPAMMMMRRSNIPDLEDDDEDTAFRFAADRKVLVFALVTSSLEVEFVGAALRCIEKG